ncbi:MAG: nucleotide exchange factor GrpE [Rhodospirillales bacterium]|nr:nucleotide exchange factor GrpE [Rhodospirillales bacterium]
MSEAKPEREEKHNGGAEAGAGAEASPAAEAPEADQESGRADSGAADERIAALESEVADLKDQLLRALAETENVRRRTQREKADAAKYAAAPLLRDFLAVADNLSRAIGSVPEGAESEGAESEGAESEGAESGDERLATLLDGVKLTEKELNAVFERHNIVKLEPLGEALDPHRHEAMFEVPDPEQPSGTVVQVIQPGYLLHDRLLRPARVGVAKGGPAKAAGEVSGEASQDEASPEPGAHVDTSV